MTPLPKGRASRTPPKWANTRVAILERDGYKCQECGSIAELVHHKITFMDGGDESPENLVSLCKSCHTKKHTGNVAISHITVSMDEDVLSRLRDYTNKKKKSLRKQSETINHLVDVGLKAEGF